VVFFLILAITITSLVQFLLVEFKKADLFLDVLLGEQVLVLFLRLREPLVNLLLSDDWNLYFLANFVTIIGRSSLIDKHRWVSLGAQAVIKDLGPAIRHGVDLLIIEEHPAIFTSIAPRGPLPLPNVDVVVVMAENYHGAEQVRFTSAIINFVELLQLHDLRYRQKELENGLTWWAFLPVEIQCEESGCWLGDTVPEFCFTLISL